MTEEQVFEAMLHNKPVKHNGQPCKIVGSMMEDGHGTYTRLKYNDGSVNDALICELELVTKPTCLECEQLNEEIKPMSGEKLLCDKCQPSLFIGEIDDSGLSDKPEPKFCKFCLKPIHPSSDEKCFSCLRIENPEYKFTIDPPPCDKILTSPDTGKAVTEAIEALKAIDFVKNLGDENHLRQLLNVYVGR